MDTACAGLLTESFGYEHTVLFGRARSALAALVKELGRPNSPVLLPSNICPEICLTIEASGCTPVSVSVDSRTGLPTDSQLAAATRNSKSGVLMPTHLYGIRASYPLAVAEAHANDWFILENDTLAATVNLDGTSPPLAASDALLLSFGASKTIGLGVGGALLTNDKALASALAQQIQAAAPFDPSQVNDEALRSPPYRIDRHSPLPPDPTAARIWSFPDGMLSALVDALKNLPRTVDRLRKQHDTWSKALVGLPLHPSPTPRIPWRWVATIDDGREDVATALRSAGFDAGVNYPPVWWRGPRWVPDAQREDAERFGRTVLNLWLHEADNPVRIRAAADLIGRTLETLERGRP